jgi:subtilisin family serine protease
VLIACAGVVLAQQSTESSSGQATKEEFVEETSSLSAGDPIPGRYIVVLNDDVSDPAAVASELAQSYDLEVTHVYQNALKGFAVHVPSGLALPSLLGSDSRVDFVAQDRVVKALAQKTPTGIDRVDADQSSTKAGDGSGAVDADIAIIDTGIYKHPDLNISGGHNCTGRHKNAWSDRNGHGTHVSGTAAAQDNGSGVVGVAPGANLWAVKVLNEHGSGSISSVICGIDWVTGKADTIKVANMSLGATVPGTDDPTSDCGWIGNKAARAMHKAICNSVNAGVFYAVAAGNDSKDFLDDVPAAFDQVLTATAMADFNGKPGSGAQPTCEIDEDDTAADFSNWTTTGSPDESHTIAAPGVCIRSTWKGGGYKTISGTSMASPHVAGTAALCIASGTCSGTPAEVMNKLRSDAAAQPASYGFVQDPNHPPGAPTYYGYLVYAGGY